ncbi:hypothetical protein ACHAQA_006085 [Verticillium albo-atrum]
MSTPHTISVSIEDPPPRDKMVSLIQREINFLSYANPQSRLLAIQTLFHPDAVWFDYDGSVHFGHDGVLARSTIILSELNGTTHRSVDDAKVCQNMATQRWGVVPDGTTGQSPSLLGGDVVVVEGQRIKVLWSYLDNFQPPIRPIPVPETGGAALT